MDQGTRDELLHRLAQVVGAVTTSHPARVAIDGPPAAGKTTLGDELATALRTQGRAVIRASIEGFLLPRAQRYRRGEYSPEGCYDDSFDFEALHRVLLAPLGPGETGGSSRRCTTAPRTTHCAYLSRAHPPMPCSSLTASFSCARN